MNQNTAFNALGYLFNAKSIAIVGASRDPKKWGYALVRNLKQGRFKGKVYPINPKATHILGYKAFPNIRAIPNEIDLAIVQLEASLIPDVLKDCVEKKVKSVVITSAGFGEAGLEGQELQEKVVKIAKSGNIRIVGPNGMGIFNSWNHMNATFAQIVPRKGYVSFVSQSGAYGISMFTWARTTGIGFSKYVSIGNRCDVDETDLLEYFVKDPHTKVVCFYIEGLRDGRRFFEAAKRVSLSKPICVLKAGKSEIGATAAKSHTGALAGSYKIYEAAFKQSGIANVEDEEELFDDAKVFLSSLLPRTSRIAIISNSGGPCVMAADACEQYGLSLPVFGETTRERLKRVLPSFASIANPLDVTATRDPTWYVSSAEIILEDENIDALIIYVPTTFTDRELSTASKKLLDKYKKPILFSWINSKATGKAIKTLEDAGIPVYPTPKRAVRAMAALAKYNDFRSKFSAKNKSFNDNILKTRDEHKPQEG